MQRDLTPRDTNFALYGAARRILTVLYRLAQSVRVHGLDNIPASGPTIIAPNHLSVHDSTLLIAVVPRVVRSIGKAEYLDDWKTSFVFSALGSIPVERDKSDSGQAALDAGAAVLDAGEVLCIFPEGTRSRDGLLHKGKTGAARLALRTGSPVLPVGISGTDQIQLLDDPVTRFRLFKDISISFGEPIAAERYQSRADQALAARQMTDDLMFEISQLSGQKYIDQYTPIKG